MEIKKIIEREFQLVNYAITKCSLIKLIITLEYNIKIILYRLRFFHVFYVICSRSESSEPTTIKLSN